MPKSLVGTPESSSQTRNFWVDTSGRIVVDITQKVKISKGIPQRIRFVCSRVGWWLKSCTTWLIVYPIIYRNLYISGGAGVLPSECIIMDWFLLMLFYWFDPMMNTNKPPFGRICLDFCSKHRRVANPCISKDWITPTVVLRVLDVNRLFHPHNLLVGSRPPSRWYIFTNLQQRSSYSIYEPTAGHPSRLVSCNNTKTIESEFFFVLPSEQWKNPG